MKELIKGRNKDDFCLFVDTTPCKNLKGLVFHSTCCGAKLWFAHFWLKYRGSHSEYVCSECKHISYVLEYQGGRS